MTEPLSQARKARTNRIILLVILALAALLRLREVDFGLPALNDPDEPLFMMKAIDMLRTRTLDPGWFGHPGTITLYCLALVVLLTGAAGVATGRFDDMDHFASAVFADPGVVFFPARLFIVACGVACVLLTWRLGKRLGGERLGLVAAGLLAVNALHIEYSRIIRTDVQASVFMLLATLAALEFANSGRTRHYLLAALWTGLAIATKWPAGLIAANAVCASCWRMSRGHRDARKLAAFAVCTVATVIAASPYLLIDYPAVLRDLAGEARPAHPGATGAGPLANLWRYLSGPVAGSMGWAGMLLSFAGIGMGAIRHPRWRTAVLAGPMAFLVVISLQSLVWDRWIVPLMPFFSLGTAYAVCLAARWSLQRFGRFGAVTGPITLVVILAPMAGAVQIEASERASDTRQIASAWIREHAPPHATILVEDAAIDLLHDGYLLLFPLGTAGCIDARHALSGQIQYREVETRRRQSPIVDVGHVSMATIASCKADYALLTHYDRYLADKKQHDSELARYRWLARQGHIVGIIRPSQGKRSGPVVYIVKLADRRKTARTELASE